MLACLILLRARPSRTDWLWWPVLTTSWRTRRCWSGILVCLFASLFFFFRERILLLTLVSVTGPQVAWRTVFFIEYLGPLLFHAALYLLRPYIYPNAPAFPSATQTLAFWMIAAHFVKREVETLWVHHFSASTMPFSNIFRNSAFYWLLAGLACGVFIYHPNSYAALSTNRAVDAFGLVIYLFGEISNAITHLHLASLRPKGSTRRAIPTGYGFGIVTCPNYMFEVIAWIGIITVTRSFMVVIFICTGIYYMQLWGRQKERQYREEFGEKYRKKRFVMLPGII